MGFEIEFVLLSEEDELYKPADHTSGYSRTAGLQATILDMSKEVLDALAMSEIPVRHFHTEVSGQLKVAIAPLPPMQAIDALYLARETIRDIFIQHDIRASMAPRPIFDGPQNGCHMHLSLSGGDIGLAEPFLAGILAKIRPLCALGMANVESYARVIHDGAGLFIGWGTDNRDLPVRKVGERHWEFRIVDATSNAYLFLAALLYAGAKGTRERLPLHFKDCNVLVEQMSSATRKEYGIIDAMPNSLGDTLEALKSDADFADWLGQDCLQQYVSGKEEEIGRFGIMDEEERRRKFVEYF